MDLQVRKSQSSKGILLCIPAMADFVLMLHGPQFGTISNVTVDVSRMPRHPLPTKGYSHLNL